VTPDTALFLNPLAGPLDAEAPETRGPDLPPRPLDVHRRLPGYAPTPLVECRKVAAGLGLGTVCVKDESNRLGLPSFKILGASYATYRALDERLGGIPAWSGINDLRRSVEPLRPLTLVAATDGNHGRAVARMARLLRFGANIYVPAGTAAARIAAIEEEGATVEVVDGDYDAAIRRSAEDEGAHHMVVSDTSWEGYERVPRWVIDGYTTIFDELPAALDGQEPTLVVVPVGVGALAAATIGRCRTAFAVPPKILGVEPASAACVRASLRAGELATVPGPHPSIMAGLNCGTPSRIAWPRLRRGLDAVVAISDDRAREAMRALAAEGIVSGETGAAALGGLTEALIGPDGPRLREHWGLGPDSRALVLSTEGATDPGAYEQILADNVAT
jgi:diaminopropionate ammonia-lyase